MDVPNVPPTVFINCQAAFRLSEFLKVASTGYQSGHMRPGLFLFALILVMSDSRKTMFKPPLGCYLPSEPWLGSVVAYFRSRGLRKPVSPWVSLISYACRTLATHRITMSTQIVCIQFLSFSLKNQVCSQFQFFYYHI